MKKKTLLITMVLTIVMSTSVFAAGGDNYGEDIFGTTSSQVTTTKASATENTATFYRKLHPASCQNFNLNVMGTCGIKLFTNPWRKRYEKCFCLRKRKSGACPVSEI